MDLCWPFLIRNSDITGKVAGLVNDQRIVRNARLRPGRVLGKISSTLLRLDIEEPRRSVIPDDLIAIVLELPGKLVEMPVPHPLRTVLRDQDGMSWPLSQPQNGDRAPVALRSITEQH